jgi:hypothetical protein
MCPHCGDLKAELPDRGDLYGVEHRLDTLIGLRDPSSLPGFVGEKKSREIGGAWLTLFGGILMVAGTFTPWTQEVFAGTIVSRNGMQLGGNLAFSVEGFFTLLLGLITCLIGIRGLQRFQMTKWLQNSSIVTGIATALLVIGAIIGTHSSVAGEYAGNASYGFGLGLLVLGCAFAIGGGFIMRANKS